MHTLQQVPRQLPPSCASGSASVPCDATCRGCQPGRPRLQARPAVIACWQPPCPACTGPVTGMCTVTGRWTGKSQRVVQPSDTNAMSQLFCWKLDARFHVEGESEPCTCIGALAQWLSSDTVAVCPLCSIVAFICSRPALNPGLLRSCRCRRRPESQTSQLTAVHWPTWLGLHDVSI
jgi:hypothetical protein